MSLKHFSLIAFALITVILLTAAGEKRPITVFMIGDSTMANKPLDNDNQERGWGQMLSGYFTSDVVVDNHAVNGRSSLSFINEGRWDAVINKVQPGDYVIIQFGHNDEKPKPDRHTEPGSTFDDNLRRFCRETKAKGGTPILMNAIVRRNFIPNPVDKDDAFGKTDEKEKTVPVEGDTLVETHILTRPDGSKANYLLPPMTVARELGVPFIDMNRLTHDYVERLGPVESKKLYCWIEPNTNLAAIKGRKDNTHLNIRGGRIIAGLAADALAETVPGLRPFIRRTDFVVAKDGSGDFFSVQEAFDAVPDFRKVPTTILVQPGEYTEKLVLAESKQNVRLIAKEEGKCILSYGDCAKTLNRFGEEVGTSGSSSCYIYAPDFTAEGITFSNSAGRVGQAVALFVKGDRAVFRRCRFLGNQDTLYPHGESNAGGLQTREYYEDCYIEGTVDFIFGWATCYFNRCHLHMLTDGYYTAASTQQGQTGFVFRDCKLTAEDGVRSYLGRPWRPYSNVVYINCEMGANIRPEGWHNWGKSDNEKTARYFEYGNTGPGANTSRRVKWARKLSAAEAADFTAGKILAGSDNWNPAGHKE